MPINSRIRLKQIKYIVAFANHKIHVHMEEIFVTNDLSIQYVLYVPGMSGGRITFFHWAQK